MIKEQKQIKHIVNVHDKCGTEIEFLPTEQWFIKILDLKKKFVEQGKKINWYPEYMFKRYENWVEGLEWDWIISRDRHFGIPIPVWKCKKCSEIIVADKKEIPVDPLQTKKKCSCGGEGIGEEKVLDTWATSSLTPQIASALVHNKIKLPYSLRPQAHDIIRTWAFYTIVKSYLHEKKIPWKNVMVSGFVTLEGEKMSKSKGNIISPQEIIEKYGADALRFWAAGSKLGEDLNYQEKDLIAGKKFINKLINASKFVFMNAKNFSEKNFGATKSRTKDFVGLKDYRGEKPKKLEKLDELFLSQINDLTEKCTKSFVNYEYNKAKLEIEKFFWNVFCSNYLEMVKWRIYQEKGNEKISAQYTLYITLLTILKLIAPIMPFVTEEIYQKYFRNAKNSKNFGALKTESFRWNEKEKSIHISKWPDKFKVKKSGKAFGDIMKFNSEIWKKKKEKGISLRDEIEMKIPKHLDKFKKDLIAMHNIK